MILYDTKYLQLKNTKTKQGHDWVYAHRPNVNGVVVILPIIEGNKFLFLVEKRPPLIAEGITERSVALPAGLVGDERVGETICDAIKAELLEETGLIADRIEIKTQNIASSPGCVSEVVTIAFAYINEYKIFSPPIDDGGIIIDRVLVDIENVYDWLKAQENHGAVLTASTLAALFYYMKG